MINNIVRKVSKNNKEDLFIGVGMFLYLFFLISSLLIIKPIRNSLFLHHYGFEKLPLAFIAVGVFALFFTKIYQNIQRRVHFKKVITWTFFISVVCLIAFYMAFKTNFVYKSQLIFIFYLWVALMGAIWASQFWLFANYLFDVRQAKRLYGFIGAGGIAGGIAGGYMTKLLTPLVGTYQMMIISMVQLCFCFILFKKIYVYYLKKPNQIISLNKKESSAGIAESFRKYPHLLSITFIVGLSVLVANIADYQFNALASEKIKSQDELTAFFGFWLSNLSLISLFFQLLLTGRILKKFGVTLSLLILPFGIMAGSVSILLTRSLVSGIILKVCDGAFKQSINKSAVELLFLPIPYEIKKKAKSFIDVTIDNLATGLSGAAILILVYFQDSPVTIVSWISIACLSIWIAFIFFDKKHYINTFRSALQSRAHELYSQTISINEGSVIKSILPYLESCEHPKQIHYLLQLIEDVPDVRFVPFIKKCLKSNHTVIRLQALDVAERYDLDEFDVDIENMIYDEEQNVKVKAFRILIKKEKDYREESGGYGKHGDIKVRLAALVALSEESVYHPKILSINSFPSLLNSLTRDQEESKFNSQEDEMISMAIAKIIGNTRITELYPLLTHMIEFDNMNIKRQALISAGRTEDRVFFNEIVYQFEYRSVKKDAREALVRFGEPIVGALKDYIESEAISISWKGEILKAISQIPARKSIDSLINWIDFEDLKVRYQVLRSINRFKNKYPNFEIDRKKVENHILKESQYYIKLLSIKKSFDDCLSEDLKNSPRFLRLNSVFNHLDRTVERIFLTVGILYQGNDLYHAYRGYVSSQKRLVANAIEFVENILPAKLKKIIVKILECHHNKGHEDSKDLIKLLKFDESVSLLLKEEDPWLKEVCCYFLYEKEYALKEKYIEGVDIPRHFVVIELNDGRKRIEKKDKRMLLNVEKAIFLQSVEIFGNTSSEDLALIANITKELKIAKGEELFNINDLSDSMFIIVSGEVACERNGRVILRAKEGEALGTWALFDDEPRVVRAFANEDSVILKINKEEFFDLLADNTKITEEILKYLSKRLRKLVNQINN